MLNIDIDSVIEYIDWTFFFFAWKMSGRYPAILEDPVKGPEAKKLMADALRYLGEMRSKRLVSIDGVCGVFPAESVGDDVVVYKDSESGRAEEVRFCFLRNQEKKQDAPNLCLADYIAAGESMEPRDHMGAFVVTAKLDEDALAPYRNDDYAVIMIKILADRLAEAAAEWIHHKIRSEIWGFAPDEKITMEQMFKSEFQGIRPAPGYPACPEHTEKGKLFSLLEAEKRIGVSLTESYTMVPAASVSAFVFAHPDSKYFNVGRIGDDQLIDYAARKEMTVKEATSWLSPNLI